MAAVPLNESTLSDRHYPSVVEQLRALVPADDTIYLVTRKTTRRGNKIVEFARITEHRTMLALSRPIAELLNLHYDQQHSGIELRGTTAARVITALSTALFGDAHKLSAEWV